MNITKFEITSNINYIEDSILAGSEMSKDLNSWESKVYYLSKLQTLIKTEISNRQNAKHPEKISDPTLLKFNNYTDIMVEFSQHCRNCKLNFDKSLDLYHSEESTKSMLFASLFTHNFSLSIKILKLAPSNLNPILEQIVDTLYLIGRSAVEKYVLALKGRIPASEYELFSSYIIISLDKKIEDKSYISNFIVKYVDGIDLQVKLLIKFGFLMKAKQIAKTKEHFLLIANLALENNNQKLYNECLKIIKKFKK